ncbi:MAG TPA: V-type ATP synthase subunit A, partial [Candidatus Hydrogenedentes bacterium]|nr:V-type ATP synthase subunit A [Candidatus Hydrogenedentota bacterium]
MTNEQRGEVVKVSGPLVQARGLAGVRMYEMVRVGDARLFGEVIEIRGEVVSIQVYEETEGIGPGQPVFRTGQPLSVELGPGLIRSIYDGVQRPLDKLVEQCGAFILRGAEAPALDRSTEWEFAPVAKAGDKVVAGDVLGTVKESVIVVHKIMVPPDIPEGTVKKIGPVKGNVETVVAELDTAAGPRQVRMVQSWPVR